MNKSQLVTGVAKELNLTKKAADETVNIVLQGIIEGVVKDGNTTLIGFGKFEGKEVSERNGRNPQNGEVIVIPAHRKIKFKPFAIFKESVE
jgi:nucleoid DNA-binding protein